jgi:hypothetical protein
MMKRRFAVLAVLTAGLAVTAIGSASGDNRLSTDVVGGGPPVRPLPPPGDFVRRIDNVFLPLVPGTRFVYRGTKDGAAAEVSVLVTRRTKTIVGVHAIVVIDRATVGGRPEEKTFDWYAQDKRGNVWYFGENSFNYVNGTWVRNEGSWEAGVDGARPGIVMEARPRVGDTYRQEYYPAHAEDMARVLSRNATVSVPYGRFEHALKTQDWTPLEPGVAEHKFYARGVGEVRSVMVRGGSEEMELVSVRGRGRASSSVREG